MKQNRIIVCSICRLTYITTLLILGTWFTGYCQSNPLKDELIEITTLSNTSIKTLESERLYLQLDKSYYTLGDTLWFKAYLLKASYFTPSDKSGIIYIDIANDSNKIIKQYIIPAEAGLSWGNISLNEKEYKTGAYTIRAYTKLMRNFGNDYFFYKSFYITGSDENNWLVNLMFNTSTVNGDQRVDAELRFSNMDKLPLILKPIDLKAMYGGKNLYRQKLQTGVDGSLHISFIDPPNVSNLSIIAENEKKDIKVVLPVILNRPENIDLQFLPEGGNLIGGLFSHIGFKAIGEDGKGVGISGVIVDSNHHQVAAFQSLHNGMGSFDINVKADENYTAKVTLPNGTVKEYALPLVKRSGTALLVKNMKEIDSVMVSVAVTNDIARNGKSLFLIGEARGIICYAAIINPNGENSIRKKIAKSMFPTGITHFVLMSSNRQPLNERLVFIDHRDVLHINVVNDQPVYAGNDSIALHLTTTNNEGKAVSANFSLAVTDDAQVKVDSLDDNIITRLLINSDLKGYVQDPGYYLQSSEPIAWQALDNMLLTQGWVGYDSKEEISKPDIIYPAETEFMIKGKVVNVLNKPVKEAQLILFSKSPFFLKSTITDNTGQFIFTHFPKTDTPLFIIKATNKNGKSFNVNIKVDESEPMPFVPPTMPLITPWYVNSDSILMNNVRYHIIENQQFNNTLVGGHHLKEVRIYANKIVKDSQNLNGAGNADFVLDEKDIEKAGKKTLLNLLEEKIVGFRIGDIMNKLALWFFLQDAVNPNNTTGQTPSPNFQWYFIKYKPVKFIVDGTSVTNVNPTPDLFGHLGGFLNITNYLNSTSAEDIKGIEVNYSDKYSLKYLPVKYALYVHPDDVAFVEITTRSGHGPIIDNTPGMYLYKPLPISWPKQFYKPRYNVADTTTHPLDLRSTIDWEPNVNTDKDGKATVSFYAADKPSTYTVIIEGTDLKGNLGYKVQRIVINDKPLKPK